MSRSLLPAILLATLSVGRGLLLAHALAAPLPGGGDYLLVEACARSIPAFDDPGWVFDARVRFLQHPEWPSRDLRMQLPEGPAQAGAVIVPQVGECWQYAARLSSPRTGAARRALWRDHLSGYARVDPGPLSRRIAPGSDGLDHLRAGLARRIADQIADPSAAALLAALAVGVTAEVSTRQWQVFNATGITHLVAISGMHVTFLALLAMAAARHAWRWFAPRAWLPRRSIFEAVVGCVFAALLSGFSVPAQRTVAMLVALLGTRECARRLRPAWSIAAALAMVLLYDPLAVLSAGFWLSFGAVSALVLVAGARLQGAAPVPELAGLQWLVGMALLPATLAIFGTFSAAGLVVNLIAIPAFTLLLVPPILIATVCYLLPAVPAAYCGDMLVRLAGAVATLLWPGLAWCADLPDALWHAVPPWSWYVLSIPAVLLVSLPLARRVRVAAFTLLASVFLLRAPKPPVGELWIDARGQGAAMTFLLRTHAHLLLLGTGEVHDSRGRRFARQLLPQLRAAGYPRIDLWLPGTLTRDAQSALLLAAAQMPVASVIPAARKPPPEFEPCSAASWNWDGVDFELRAGADGRECTLAMVRGNERLVIDRNSFPDSGLRDPVRVPVRSSR